MNRRGFIAALAAFASWFGRKQKKPAGAYDELERIEFVGIHSTAEMAAWVELHYGETHEILEWGGQSVFPIVANDGGLSSSSIAYAIRKGWRERYPRDQWFDGGTLGRSPARIVYEL